MPFLATISILLGYGFILSYERIKINKKFIILNQIVIKYKVVLSLIPIIITVFGIFIKASFWERENFYFYKFGDKIKNITSPEDVIMYHSTVSDGWCATRRNFVQDIAYAPGARYRVKNEVEKYDITHILIDISDYIYPRSQYGNIEKIKNFYHDIQLEEVLRDEKNGYYFYKIAN